MKRIAISLIGVFVASLTFWVAVPETSAEHLDAKPPRATTARFSHFANRINDTRYRQQLAQKQRAELERSRRVPTFTIPQPYYPPNFGNCVVIPGHYEWFAGRMIYVPTRRICPQPWVLP